MPIMNQKPREGLAGDEAGAGAVVADLCVQVEGEGYFSS